MSSLKIQQWICQLAGDPTKARRPRKMLPRLDAFVRKTNKHEIQIYPEQAVVLAEICRLIDNEPHGPSAWEKAVDVDKSGVYKPPPAHDEAQFLVSSSVLDSTVAYINRHEREVATGVLVEVDRRIFLATTAHSVPANPQKKLSFVGRESTAVDDRIAPIISSGTDSDYKQRDVGFLELERDFVTHTLKKRPIPLSRVYPCGTGQEGFWTYVGGYPSSEVVTSQSGRTMNQLYTLNCWANNILMPTVWDVLTKDVRLPNQEYDVFIAYPRDEDIVALGPYQGKTPDQLPVPKGMSGGGYWQQRQKKVWSPENYCLIAIQSRWWDWGRYLQATQIIHWLRLLWQHKSELRQSLENAFPEHEFTAMPPE